MQMLSTLACGCGSLEGRHVAGDVEEDFGQLPDEDSFTCESIGGSSSPLSQRWRRLTGRWRRDAGRDALGVMPLDVVDVFQPNVGR